MNIRALKAKQLAWLVGLLGLAGFVSLLGPDQLTAQAPEVACQHKKSGVVKFDDACRGNWAAIPFWQPGGSDTLNYDGDVGIGTASPGGFQVVLPESSKSPPTQPGAGITMAGGARGNASIELRNAGSGTPYIDFAQNASSTDFDARIRLVEPGSLAIEGSNFGIGTTTPGAKLHVADGDVDMVKVLGTGENPDVGFLLQLGPQDKGSEGGHLEFKGAPNGSGPAFQDYVIDNYAGKLRIFEPHLSRTSQRLRGAALEVSGTVFATSFDTSSSRRWKTDIDPIEGALDKLQRLRGVTYNWTVDGKRDIGLIAEEVGEVVPEVVVYEENGVDAKAVDYSRLVPLLIEAVKEQQAGLEERDDQIASLELRISDLEKSLGTKKE